MKTMKLDRCSIRIQLVTAFLVTSVIPILLVNIIFYFLIWIGISRWGMTF